MYGAIIGDIVGSKYEFDPKMKFKSFLFFSPGCSYTDDTIMTVAAARALIEACVDKTPFKRNFISQMRELGRRFPYPQGGYGGRFGAWLISRDPAPYNSCGNGSAMRVSPCGLIAVSLGEALDLAKASAEVTHNSTEGIKGAEAVAAAVFLAKAGTRSKEEIKDYIRRNFYELNETLDEIRPSYGFSETCQDTVPQAITAFLESENYEDAIRNAVSLGGDSDTLAAITGSIAWAYYKSRFPGGPHAALPDDMARSMKTAKTVIPPDFAETAEKFEILCSKRASDFAAGRFDPIPTE